MMTNPTQRVTPFQKLEAELELEAARLELENAKGANAICVAEARKNRLDRQVASMRQQEVAR